MGSTEREIANYTQELTFILTYYLSEVCFVVSRR